MAAPERVLLDTSALYALVSSTDEFHQQAERAYRQLLASDTELWITSYIFIEFGALTQRRLGFDLLAAFVESTKDVYQTLWIDGALHRDAWLELHRRGGAGLNFVDWSTAVAARRLGAEVFTFDMGFEREGIAVLPRIR